MSKKFAICALCKAKKMLNYASLCKNCNKKKAAGSIKDVISKQQDLAQAKAEHEHMVEHEAELEAASHGVVPKVEEAKKPEVEEKLSEQEKKEKK